MPYIITTMPAGSAAHPERMSRRAVATLEEARWDGVRLIQRITQNGSNVEPYEEWHALMDALPEAGGTVGPLPGGTVIEVRSASRSDLLDGAVRSWATSIGDDDASIIAAFNAR